MTFEQRLAAAARGIDAALDLALADASPSHPPMAVDGEAVPARLAAAMRHAVMAGGKRIRPFLVIESAGLFGVPPERALPTALALELVHCYSLVHDDLPAMDNDELRRGQPTVWKAFDDWTAILAGDALLTLAFDVASRPVDGLCAATQMMLVRSLAQASGGGGMVGGQCLDLEADKLPGPPVTSVRQIDRLQAMKTGALFGFACRSGAVLGAAATPDVASLAAFGADLGAAFQLADDLLDVEGDAVVVGKATAKDAVAGKATLVGLKGVAAARARLRELETSAHARLAGFGAEAEGLRECLRFAVSRSR